MITTREQLKEAVREILELGSVALDTEFFWERTFYPRLGVVQLGLPDGRCRLVDAPAVGGFEPGGLEPLGRLLASRRVTKILHDAPQDLYILHRATGALPRKIFDTRCAAGFAGLLSTISLGNMLEELFGIRLPKTETRADWLKRPLSRRQVAYAEDDVKHLHAARDELLRRAGARGTARWVGEELAGLDEPELYQEKEPRQHYLRMKGTGRLTGRELAVLRELAAWREETARERDLPRGRVLADKALIHLARTQPRTNRSLTGRGRIGERTARRVGKALLAAVQVGLAVEPDQCPPAAPGHRARGAPGAMVDRAVELVRAAAERQGVDPALVAARAEIRALVTAGAGARPEDYRLLRGWRKKLVGKELVGLLASETQAEKSR